jgi:elongation factor Ts
MSVAVAATADQIKKLREMTSAGIMDCRRALEETSGDLDKAMTLLRERGAASAAKKSDRVAEEGTVMAYVHHGGKLGAIIELNCETDFVARNEEFVSLAKELAMQVAATSPRWITKEEVPADYLEAQKVEFRKQANDLGKGAQADTFVTERIEQMIGSLCLLEQAYIRDQALTVASLINDKVAKFGERIRVKRFTVYKLGEVKDDSAA